MALVTALEETGAEVIDVAGHVLASLSDTETPQGILAVMPFPTFAVPGVLDFVVIADTLRDPGNLGTILRTAAAAGAQAVVLSPATADPYSPKVVRAGMGAHFRLPLFLSQDWAELRSTIQQLGGEQPLRVCTASALGNTNLWEYDFRQPVAIMVSNEAVGTSLEGIKLTNDWVGIPMPGNVESLNAAIAAGILMFEVVRQRGKTNF